MKSCPHCQLAGRAWNVLDGDRFCGLCGRVLFDVEVSASGTVAAPRVGAGSDGGADADRPLVWMVAPGQSEARATVYVRNVGCFGAGVTSVDVEVAGAGGARVAARTDFKGPASLANRGDVIPVAVTVPIGPQGPVRLTATVVVRGPDYGEHRLAFDVHPAPPKFVAAPLADDAFSLIAGKGMAAAEGGLSAAAAAAGDDAAAAGPVASLRWELSELMLVAWRDGEARFELSAAAADWQFGGRLPGVAAGAALVLEGADGKVVGQVEQDPSSEYPLRFAVRLNGPVGGEVRGTVRLPLAALGAPEVLVRLLVVGGRPEFRCTEPDATTTVSALPAGYFSVLRVGFSPVVAGERGAGRALEEEVASHDLRVWTRPPVDVRAVRLSPPAGTADRTVRHRLRVQIPAAAREVEVRCQLVGVLKDGRPVALSPEHVLPVKAYDPAGPVRKGTGPVLVVDFGTSNTCLCLAQGANSSSRCLDMGDVAKGEEQGDVIPTALWVGADPQAATGPGARAGVAKSAGARDGAGGAGAGADPPCLIGAHARDRRSKEPSAGHLFTAFKPELDNPREVYRLGPGGGDTCSAAELTFYFLRELLLEARSRAEIGQRPVSELLVTCPTTFSAGQRKALGDVLERLRPYGVAAGGRAAIHLDEANAGAFADVDRHLRASAAARAMPKLDVMILDFGGGTIDVALIRATRVEREGYAAAQFALEPMGVTGLRDFAGQKITRAIADLLGRRLARYLYDDRRPPVQLGRETKQLKVGHMPWVPLPSLAATSAAERELARRNEEFLFDVAELVKTRSYGDAGANGTGKKPPAELLGKGGVDGLNLRGLSSRVYYLSALGAAEAVDRAEVEAWLKALSLPREEVDAALRPALLEAFERARLLWEKVSQQPAAPDLLLLAGAASQLPVIRQVAAEELLIEDDRILFDRVSAKRKVAVGGAMYANVRHAPKATLDLAPPDDPSDFVLLPITYETDGPTYQEIFPPAYRISRGVEVPVVLSSTGRIDLRLFENCDYRETPWDPEHFPELRALGLTAHGKEKLNDVTLEVKSGGRVTLKFSLAHGRSELGEPEHARVLVIRFPDPSGAERVERVVL